MRLDVGVDLGDAAAGGDQGGESVGRGFVEGGCVGGVGADFEEVEGFVLGVAVVDYAGGGLGGREVDDCA